MLLWQSKYLFTVSLFWILLNIIHASLTLFIVAQNV